MAQLSTIRVTQHGSFGKADNVDYPGVGGFFSDLQGNAVAVHLADGSAVTPQNPARPGDVIAAYGTGFGATYPPKPIGFPAPTEPRFQGTMNFTEPNTSYNLDMPAQQLSLEQLSLESNVLHVSFSGVANGLAGVDQIVFLVPAGLSTGSHTLRLAAGVIACQPPPFAQPCGFEANVISNGVKIQVE